MDGEALIDKVEVLSELINSINLEDTRIDRKKKHSLSEVLLLVLCAQLCSYTTLREYEHYGKIKIDFLRKILPYRNGVPSRSTISRVLALLKPKALEGLLKEWAKLILAKIQRDQDEQRVLAVDGKTSRGAQNIHLVNVYDTSNSLCLGQEKVGEKSNEITAIPLLLDSLCIEGQIVSIDAMGCQKKIAELIINKKADYFLALKGNHENFFDDVKTYFDYQPHLSEANFFESIDAGHGRIEVRRCYATNDIKWIEGRNEWKKLASIVMIESKRIIKDQESIERRYFITSMPPDARKCLSVSRAHWGIENSLNWVLDVIFNEDDRIIWNDNIAQNESLIRRMGLNLLKQYQIGHAPKVALKTLRKGFIVDDNAMLTLLSRKF
jgi:predicted transposase YbfD/YdcC